MIRNVRIVLGSYICETAFSARGRNMTKREGGLSHRKCSPYNTSLSCIVHEAVSRVELDWALNTLKVPRFLTLQVKSASLPIGTDTLEILLVNCGSEPGNEQKQRIFLLHLRDLGRTSRQQRRRPHFDWFSPAA